MGLVCSKGSSSLVERRRSMLAVEGKIENALRKKNDENKLLPHPITFQKILLKFETMRKVLGYVKAVFAKVAKEGRLDQEGFQSTMKRLNADMTIEQVKELLEFADLENSHTLTIKEFFVALVIGCALDELPSLTKSPAKSLEESAASTPNTSSN